MSKSQEIGNIIPALLAAQKAFSSAKKDGKSHHGKYATLEAVLAEIKGPLNDNGIFFTQCPGFTTDGPVVDTILFHESGEWVSTTTPVYVKDRTNPQAFGSGLTYAKRYALMSICALPTEDDDGNKANRGEDKAAGPKLPPVNLSGLTDAWLKKYSSAEAAIAEISMIRDVNKAAASTITDMWVKATGQ